MCALHKTAIVTGGSRGIGRGIALKLAECGYDLFITHLDEKDEAEQTAKQIANQFQRRCEVLQIDLIFAESPKQAVDAAVHAYGKIHLLVNNAGLSTRGKVTDMPNELTDYVMHLNFRAPMLATKYISSHMIEQDIRGSIINIASSRAERAYPTDYIYGGLKAALTRATQSIALDLAPYGIRVNCVSPGAIQVREGKQEVYERLGQRIPLGRVGLPDDIGKAVAWLSSDEASYITGVNLRVDGGLILPGMPEREDFNPTDGWWQP